MDVLIRVYTQHTYKFTSDQHMMGKSGDAVVSVGADKRVLPNAEGEKKTKKKNKKRRLTRLGRRRRKTRMILTTTMMRTKMKREERRKVS